MLLADLGAEVLRIDRLTSGEPDPRSREHVLLRGRRSIALDLKHELGPDTFLRLVERADGVIEGFRPGVMERLGVGPDICLARNPRLVFGRMTGWGQDGPLADRPGHDINYIALAGALAHFGTATSGPVPPLNLVGDFAGGGLFLALGTISSWLERARSGQGQILDAAMVDGAAVLMTMFWGSQYLGRFDENARGRNMLDGGAPFYRAYECSDGEYIAVGSIEPKFYTALLEHTGLADKNLADQMDASSWPEQAMRLAEVFATKTRAEWTSLLQHTDVCFAPVLTMSEAARHPHNVARQTFVVADGIVQPAPAPRFSRTPTALGLPPAYAGEHTHPALAEWGFSTLEIDTLLHAGAIR
jgi:alpha-methylacyl-CoA racemase